MISVTHSLDGNLTLLEMLPLRLSTLFFFFFSILCRAASSAAYSQGDLEWEVESATVTHSSADW